MIFGICLSVVGYFCVFCHFWGFWGLWWFWGQFGDEHFNIFWSHVGVFDPFLTVLFFGVFLSARFSCFLWFWVARGSILVPILLHFWEPWPSEKVWKVYNYRQFQRFDPFQTESFCMPWLRVRFDDEFLWIFVILGCFGAPILRPFGTNSRKKWGLKKLWKKCVKRVTQWKLGGVRLSP